MKLSKRVDARMIFRNIYLLLMGFLLAELLVQLINSRDSFSSSSIFFYITMLAIILISDYVRNNFFEKPYLYLDKLGKKVSPINDTPITLTDITGYSVNNPFPSFSRLVWSSQNLTLYFHNRKSKTLFAKEQSMLIDWLKENNISCISKTNRKNVIEHISYTAANIFFILFYLYQIKTVYTEVGFTCLLISAACFVYLIIYILSGLYIRKQKKAED